MSSPDVTTDEGFQAYLNGVTTMIYANSTFPGWERRDRVVQSVKIMELVGFTVDELRAQLAMAVDMIAFPKDWSE